MNLLASGLVSALMGLVMLGVLYRTPRGALRKAACRAGGLERMTTTSFYMRNCWNWQTGSVEVAVFIRACGFKSHVPHHMSKWWNGRHERLRTVCFGVQVQVLSSAPYAEMAKLVDASASKADVERRVGPSPTFGTNQPPLLVMIVAKV